MPYGEFIELVRQSGAAESSASAQELALVLHRAGVVLLHHNYVYLHPEEIATMITQILPGGREDAQQRLAIVNQELAEMDRLHADLDKAAHRLTNRMLYAGYLVLLGQIVVFIVCTWDWYSWDVMEPIAYIISLFYTLVGYTYFLSTKGGTFDLGPFKKHWHKHIKAQKALEAQFDEDRYQHLLRLKERYERHLAYTAIKQ